MTISYKIAAIWARVSSEGQKELSPDGQVERVRSKLTAEGYSIPPEYVFKVVWTSLDLESCAEFKTLKTLIRTKKINAVGFLDRDRIEAVSLQRLLFLSECRDNDVQPICCQGAPFMTEPEGQLVEMALALGKERSVLRAQSGAKQGLEDRVKKKGLPASMKSPYGYKWEKDKLLPTQLIPTENLKYTRLIWDMALKGFKTKQICRELTSRGIPTSYGRALWYPSSIIAILKNPAYTGRIAALRYERIMPIDRRKGTYGKTSVREKPPEQWHYLDGLVKEPIISSNQFDEVQERLVSNKLYASRNTKGTYLLRGLMECQLCHTKYYGVQRKGQQPGYVCQRAWAQMYGKKCQAKPIKCSLLDEAVKIKVRNFLNHPDVYMADARGTLQDVDRAKNNLEQSITDLEKQLQDNIFQEQKALRLLSEDAFINEQKSILTRRSWLEQELINQQTKLDGIKKVDFNIESVESIRQRLQNNLDKATDEDWRFILETLGVKVYMFGDGTWDIEFNVPIINKTPWGIVLAREL